jgi:branched-chain amino acid transport system permease protein
MAHSAKAWTAIAVFATLALLPIVAHVLKEPFVVTFCARVMIFGLAALSLNLILGFGGMTSLGHAAFLGVGAYTVGLLMHNGVVNGYVHIAAVLACGVASSLLIGALCLRTGGLSFIMLSLAFAQLLYVISTGMKGIGGDDGFSFRGRSDFVWFTLADDTTLYYFILVCLAGATLLVYRLIDSPFGLVLRGIKSNERRVESVGLHAYRYKLVAFVISGTMCTVAGGLLANLAQFVSPSYMHWSRSAELLVMALLGGMTSVLGPVAGTAAYMLLEEGLGHTTRHWQAPLGLILMVVVIFARNGLAGFATALYQRIKGARAASKAEAETKTRAGTS